VTKRALDFLKSFQGLLAILFPLTIPLGQTGPDVVVSLSAFSFLLYSLIQKEWAWAKKPIFCLLFAFWGLAVLNSFFASNPGISLKSALPFGRYIFFLAMLLEVAFRQKRVCLWVPRFLLGVCVLSALDGVYQQATGFDILGIPKHNAARLTGPFHFPRLGYMLSWLLFPVLLPFLSKGTILKRMLYGVCGALIMGTTLLSGDRMAMLMTGFGGVCLLLFFKKTSTRWIFAIAGIVGLGTTVLSQLIPTLLSKPSQSSTLSAQSSPSVQPDDLLHSVPCLQRGVAYTTESIRNFSENGYFFAFLHGIILWKKAPLFGLGLKQYRLYRLDKAHLPERMPEVFSHSHNTFVEILCGTGLVGFFLMLGVFFLIFRQIWQQRTRVRQNPQLFGLALTFFLLTFPLVGGFTILMSVFGTIFWFLVGWLLCSLEKARMGQI